MTNPLKGNGEQQPSRKWWSAQQHCDHANQQIVEKRINEDRSAKGMFPVHWVVRDGMVKIERLRG